MPRSSFFQPGDLEDPIDDWTRLLLSVLSSHRKLPTRIVHLVCSFVAVASLMVVVHALSSEFIGLPVQCLLLLVFFWRKSGGRMLIVGTSLFFVFGLATTLLLTLLPKSHVRFDEVIDASLLRITAAKAFGVYLVAGLVELASHKVFSDVDQRTVTRGKRGAVLVRAVVTDVILPGPMLFLHLMFIDFDIGGVSTEELLKKAAEAVVVVKEA